MKIFGIPVGQTKTASKETSVMKVIDGNIPNSAGGRLTGEVLQVSPKSALLNVLGQQVSLEGSAGFKVGDQVHLRLTAGQQDRVEVSVAKQAPSGAATAAQSPSRSASAPGGLRVGQELIASVVEREPNGRVVLDVDGRQMSSRLPRGLEGRSVLPVVVEQTQPEIVFRVRSGMEGAEKTAEQLLRTLDERMPAGRSAAALRSALTNLDLLPSRDKLPQAVLKLDASLKSMVPQSATAAQPEGIASFLRDGGLSYESRIAQLANEDFQTLRQLPDRDLKGLLLQALRAVNQPHDSLVNIKPAVQNLLQQLPQIQQSFWTSNPELAPLRAALINLQTATDGADVASRLTQIRAVLPTVLNLPGGAADAPVPGQANITGTVDTVQIDHRLMELGGEKTHALVSLADRTGRTLANQVTARLEGLLAQLTQRLPAGSGTTLQTTVEPLLSELPQFRLQVAQQSPSLANFQVLQGLDQVSSAHTSHALARGLLELQTAVRQLTTDPTAAAGLPTVPSAGVQVGESLSALARLDLSAVANLVQSASQSIANQAAQQAAIPEVQARLVSALEPLLSNAESIRDALVSSPHRGAQTLLTGFDSLLRSTNSAELVRGALDFQAAVRSLTPQTATGPALQSQLQTALQSVGIQSSSEVARFASTNLQTLEPLAAPIGQQLLQQIVDDPNAAGLRDLANNTLQPVMQHLQQIQEHLAFQLADTRTLMGLHQALRAIRSAKNGESLLRAFFGLQVGLQEMAGGSGDAIEQRLTDLLRQAGVKNPTPFVKLATSPGNELAERAASSLQTSFDQFVDNESEDTSQLARLRSPILSQLMQIESQQLVNLLSQLHGTAYQFEIPVLIEERPTTAYLSIGPDEEGGTERDGETGGHNVLLMLDLESLGAIRIDANVTANSIRVIFYMDDDDTRSLFDVMKADLDEGLRTQGFEQVQLAGQPLHLLSAEKRERFQALSSGSGTEGTSLVDTIG